MSQPSVSCQEFEAEAEELALGVLEEPRRSLLTAHAARCSRCQQLLDGLVAVADTLLLVAPEVEPPAGFESRALARLGGTTTTAPRPRRPPWWVAAVAAVAALLLALGAWAVIDGGSTSSERVAGIVTADGRQVGAVHLVEAPSPHVLVVVPEPRPGPGARTCELQRADGTWATVGSWTYEQISSGIWAVGVTPDLLDATAMRITSEDGTVLASAAFT